MRRRKLIFKAVTFTRQLMNWWLGYVLSQPVDIDLSVLGYFMRSYIGYGFVMERTKRLRYVISERFTGSGEVEFEKVAA